MLHTSHTSSHSHDTLKPNISVIIIDLRLKIIQGTNVNIPNLLLQNLLKSANLRFTYTSELLTAKFYGVIRRLQRQNINRGSRSIFDLQPIMVLSSSLQVLSRFSPGSLQFLFRFSPGSSEVLSRFSPGCLRVLSRFSPGSLQVLLRFSPGSFQFFTNLSPGAHPVLSCFYPVLFYSFLFY